MNYKQLRQKTIADALSHVNRKLESIGVVLTANVGHIIGRMEDRDLDPIDFYNCLVDFSNKRLGLFAYYTNLPRKEIPFKIYITADNIIIHLSLEDDKVWKISTILDPKKHNKHPNPTKFTQYIWIDECLHLENLVI